MKVLRVTALAFVLLAVGVSTASAAEPVTGRWAMDPASCSSFGAARPLIVTDTALRWRDDACRIARMYKAGDTVHIQAQCFGADGERSIPVSLRLRGDRLEVRWDRNAAGNMRRCP
jgi:hypothetical protein